MSRPVRSDAGFTLLEALVAMAVLAIVVVQFLGMRTNALIDAAEARNRRIAREIAQHYLSELQAGAREIPPDGPRVSFEVEEYPSFSCEILVGEAAISDAESEMAETVDSARPDGATSANDRLSWQRERDSLRRAQQKGMSMLDYQDQLREKEMEERIPSEDELEDVAVIVYYPNVRPSDEEGSDTASFILKAKISTMAIECVTPERAELIAQQRGGATADAGTAGASLPGGSK